MVTLAYPEPRAHADGGGREMRMHMGEWLMGVGMRVTDTRRRKPAWA